MNGYFYLEHTQDALNLVIVPPTEGGEAVTYVHPCGKSAESG